MGITSAPRRGAVGGGTRRTGHECAHQAIIQRGSGSHGDAQGARFAALRPRRGRLRDGTYDVHLRKEVLYQQTQEFGRRDRAL